MRAKLSSKGQMTIPKDVREYLKLKEGDIIRFAINKLGEVVLSPKKSTLDELKTIFPKPKRAISVEEMNDTIAKSAILKCQE